MVYFQDLSPLDFPLVAIGWLEPPNPFPTGTVNDRVLKRLVHIARWNLEFPFSQMFGRHSCGFCDEAGLEGPGFEQIGSYKLPIGRRNLTIPGKGGKVYSCPSTIVHYIRQHDYCPPQEFQLAVLSCPSPLSPLYYANMAVQTAYKAFLMGTRS